MTEDDFARECPVCQFNCNCKSCLRLEVLVKVSIFSLLFVWGYMLILVRCPAFSNRNKSYLVIILVCYRTGRGSSWNLALKKKSGTPNTSYPCFSLF